MSQIEKIFSALSATPRRLILAYISETPLTAGKIAEKFEMSQPAVSKHLAILENAGLIWKKKQGQYIIYGMEHDTLSGTLADFMQETCPSSRKLKKESNAIGKEKSDE